MTITEIMKNDWHFENNVLTSVQKNDEEDHKQKGIKKEKTESSKKA